MKRFFGCAFLLFLALFRWNWGQVYSKSGPPIVQVLLLKAPQVVIQCSVPFLIDNIHFQPGGYAFFAVNGVIHTNTNALGHQVVISSPSPLDFLAVNGKPYRGSISLQASGNFLKVFNQIDLETYLYGVVGEEMPSNALEALKAQAVASRTLALDYFLKGGVLRDSVSQQVYGGVDGERQSASEAVDATRGIVLMYQGKLARSPLFFSTCGGKTENSQDVFGGKVPYLQSVVDAPSSNATPYCSISPYFRWDVFLSPKDIGRNAASFGIQGQVINLVPVKVDENGRVQVLEIQTTKGEWKVEGFPIREVLRQPNGKLLNSTWFTVQKVLKDGSVYFELSGKGEGHGVGLCQWGAVGMALTGKSYQDILTHYYPGTHFAKLY